MNRRREVVGVEVSNITHENTVDLVGQRIELILFSLLNSGVDVSRELLKQVPFLGFGRFSAWHLRIASFLLVRRELLFFFLLRFLLNLLHLILNIILIAFFVFI